MLKCVIFDMDGTIIDSIPDIHHSVNALLKELAFEPVSLEQVYRFVGAGVYKLVERACSVTKPCDEAFLKKATARYLEIYGAASYAYATVYDGIYEVLSALSERGVKLAVFSNKEEGVVKLGMDLRFSQFEFFRVYGDNGVRALKPDPSAALEIAKLAEASPDEVAFVGDGEADFLTGKNAGVHAISVLWGYRTQEELAKEGARTFVKTPKELLELLLKL